MKNWLLRAKSGVLASVSRDTKAGKSSYGGGSERSSSRPVGSTRQMKKSVCSLGNYSSQLDVLAPPLTVFVQTNQEKHIHSQNSASTANVANFFLSFFDSLSIVGMLEYLQK